MRMHKNEMSKCVVLVFLGFALAGARAGTTWTGGGASPSWGDAGNWGGALPAFDGTETLVSNQGMEIPVIGAASSSSVDQSQERKAEFLVFDISRQHAEWNILVRRFNLNLQEKAFFETQSQRFRVSVNS